LHVKEHVHVVGDSNVCNRLANEAKQKDAHFWASSYMVSELGWGEGVLVKLFYIAQPK